MLIRGLSRLLASSFLSIIECDASLSSAVPLNFVRYRMERCIVRRGKRAYIHGSYLMVKDTHKKKDDGLIDFRHIDSHLIVNSFASVM